MKDTLILFHRIYNGNISAIDYVNWAVAMLLKDIENMSIKILASLDKPVNIFEAELYFGKAFDELGLVRPTEEEATRAYVQHLSERILKDPDSDFTIAKEIEMLVIELGYPEDLFEWLDIGDMIDCLKYDNYSLGFTERDVHIKIIYEAKRQVSLGCSLCLSRTLRSTAVV